MKFVRNVLDMKFLAVLAMPKQEYDRSFSLVPGDLRVLLADVRLYCQRQHVSPSAQKLSVLFTRASV
jgi:hypothetical protein